MNTWVAVSKHGIECIFDGRPERGCNTWDPEGYLFAIGLPKGSIQKLIGRELTWEDDPVKLS